MEVAASLHLHSLLLDLGPSGKPFLLASKPPQPTLTDRSASCPPSVSCLPAFLPVRLSAVVLGTSAFSQRSSVCGFHCCAVSPLESLPLSCILIPQSRLDLEFEPGKLVDLGMAGQSALASVEVSRDPMALDPQPAMKPYSPWNPSSARASRARHPPGSRWCCLNSVRFAVPFPVSAAATPQQNLAPAVMTKKAVAGEALLLAKLQEHLKIAFSSHLYHPGHHCRTCLGFWAGVPLDHY